MNNKHPKGKMEGNWHIEYEPNLYTPGRKKRTCKFYDTDKKCCCNVIAPDFSVGCHPGHCGYYEYGKPISEKSYKIPQQMLIQEKIAATLAGKNTGKNKKRKKQKKTTQPIANPRANKKNWTGCKSVIVYEFSHSGEDTHKTFYLEKPVTGQPTAFAVACKQAHVGDIVQFNGLKYKIIRFK